MGGQDPAFPYGAKREPRRGYANGYGGYWGSGENGGYGLWPCHHYPVYGCYGYGYGKRSADSTGVVRVAKREAKADPDVDPNNNGDTRQDPAFSHGFPGSREADVEPDDNPNNGDNEQDPAFPYGVKREPRNRYYGYGNYIRPYYMYGQPNVYPFPWPINGIGSYSYGGKRSADPVGFFRGAKRETEDAPVYYPY